MPSYSACAVIQALGFTLLAVGVIIILVGVWYGFSRGDVIVPATETTPAMVKKPSFWNKWSVLIAGVITLLLGIGMYVYTRYSSCKDTLALGYSIGTRVA